MAKKPRERYKDRNKTEAAPDGPKKEPATLEILRRRRNKRFLFVGLVAIAFPIFEVIAYQFRAITVSFTNRSDLMVRSVKVSYDGGSFEIPEIRPGGVAARVIRPDFRFTSDSHLFSTYKMSISLCVENGQILRTWGRAGALDYSAQELYTIEPVPPKNDLQLQHSTRPGFPLSLVRDLMDRMGFR